MSGARRVRRVFSLAALAALTFAGAAAASSAPDAGTAFKPRPASESRFAISPPSASSQQTHYVRAKDGVEIYVETSLPATSDGREPPARVPTILVMTPYEGSVSTTLVEGYNADLIDYLVPRGYAVSIAHVRGTGASGGCIDQTGPLQIDDGARVVEYLGRDAAWSSGRVGMYGLSYDAETQLSVAGLGDRARTRYLKAIVPVASVGGQYEYVHYDGSPYLVNDLGTDLFYLLTSLDPPTGLPGQLLGPGAPLPLLGKLGCQPEAFSTAADLSGDITSYWREREYRPGASRIRAATLAVHGLRDFNVLPIALDGYFDRIPDRTPHKGLFGVWEHAFPDAHDVESAWQRSDWMPMVAAWFDRFLKGRRTAVKGWPDVQVQDSTGQWRAERDFPSVDGPPAQLALSSGGALGARDPSGSSTFSQLTLIDAAAAGGLLPVGAPPPDLLGPIEEVINADRLAVFETEPVSAPLRITGVPVADLWLRLSEPGARVAVRLQVVDDRGDQIGEDVDFGYRSTSHLEPIRAGHFTQSAGRPAPTDKPLRVPVRLLPTDLTVPEGARLRLTLVGSLTNSLPGLPAADVSVLHDCTHTSALRFLLPGRDAQLLNVREADEPSGTPLTSRPARLKGRGDGGGLARAPICGRPPTPPRRALSHP